jgi:hypothetical protein
VPPNGADSPPLWRCSHPAVDCRLIKAFSRTCLALACRVMRPMRLQAPLGTR